MLFYTENVNNTTEYSQLPLERPQKNELPGGNFQQKCLKMSDTIEKAGIVYNLFTFMYT